MDKLIDLVINAIEGLANAPEKDRQEAIAVMRAAQATARGEVGALAAAVAQVQKDREENRRLEQAALADANAQQSGSATSADVPGPNPPRDPRARVVPVTVDAVGKPIPKP